MPIAYRTKPYRPGYIKAHLGSTKTNESSSKRMDLFALETR